MPSYDLRSREFCILEDDEIAAASVAAYTAVGAGMACALLSSLFSQSSTGNLWSLFNVLQIVEIVALLELDYPQKLEQFFHGF